MQRNLWMLRRKKQRKRGTNHADWHFLSATRITVWGQVNVQECMYVKKISLVRSIISSSCIQEHFISSLEYDEEIEQLKVKLDMQVEFRHAIVKNPAMF